MSKTKLVTHELLIKERQLILLFALLLFSLCNNAYALESSKTNVVEGVNGAVSSGSLLASEVGVQIMKQGGNAIDAAVATGFALAVTHPNAGNLGGGTFFVIRLANGATVSLDAREVAPLASHKNMFQNSNGEVVKGLSTDTRLASGVPGTVDGLLSLHQKYGNLSREEVIAPAITLAQKGFLVDKELAADFERQRGKFRVSKASLRKFTKKGEPLKEGYRWKQKDLAKTLKRISKEGRSGFYSGKTAELIIKEMKNGNGIISLLDLANYESRWRQPLKGTYRDYNVISMPPSSSGGVLIVQMLNMLESYPIGNLKVDNPDLIHMIIEAERRAYADRSEHLGDTDFYDVPIEKLTSKYYADKRFSDFKINRASDSNKIGAGSWPDESPETTHYSVVDKNGNAVSATTTLNFSYGNKITVAGAGFLLNNEMDDFSTKPGVPNAYGLIGNVANEVQPRKRMLSSMSPTIVTKDGKLVLVTGSPGGSTIITTTLQVLINVLDHKMDLKEAIDTPRFHHQWKPNVVRYENEAFSSSVLEQLKIKQHQGLSVSKFPLGDANSIMVKEGDIKAYNDQRRRGGAAAF